MPEFQIVGSERHGNPCDTPRAPHAIAQPVAITEAMRLQAAEGVQWIETTMGQIAVVIERIVLDAANRISREVTACLKIPKRCVASIKLCRDESEALVLSVRDRLHGYILTTAQERCADAVQCLRHCTARCVLREAGELGGDTQEYAVSAVTDGPVERIQQMVGNVTAGLSLPDVSVATIVRWLMAGRTPVEWFASHHRADVEAQLRPVKPLQTKIYH